MAKEREPDSKVVAEGRVKLAVIVDDLRAIKARALALSRQLKHASRVGEIVGKVDGRPYTVEDWCADSLKGLVHDAGLDEAIREFANEIREDYRKMARFHVVKTLNGMLTDGGTGKHTSAT